MGTRCFMLTPTEEYAVTLRRYSREGEKCPSPHGYHDADVRIDVVKWDGKSGRSEEALKRLEVAWGIGLDPVKSTCAQYPGVTSYQDHRWPKKCEHCTYEFAEADNWQLNLHVLLSRSDGGPLTTLHNAPVGAMYWANWNTDKGFDGRSLAVIIPGHHVWMVDGEASNCTKRGDKSHRCWIRHGEPPDVTVDKNGVTCDAGAGSIISPSGWHGFLTKGELVP